MAMAALALGLQARGQSKTDRAYGFGGAVEGSDRWSNLRVVTSSAWGELVATGSWGGDGTQLVVIHFRAVGTRTNGGIVRVGMAEPLLATRTLKIWKELVQIKLVPMGSIQSCDRLSAFSGVFLKRIAVRDWSGQLLLKEVEKPREMWGRTRGNVENLYPDSGGSHD